MARRQRITLFTVVGAGALVACSAGTNNHPSPPSPFTYEIQFPSTQTAVGADTVQVFVFSRATPKTDCPSLITVRTSRGNLPATVAQTDQLTLCDVLTSTTSMKGQLPSVPYGDVSFLVVAQRGGIDYFTGCALATLSATSGPVAVSLTAASNTTPIPATNCMSVSAHCATPPTCTVGGDGGA
jgi:hypothetical protein